MEGDPMAPVHRHGLRGYVLRMNNRDCWAYKILDGDGDHVERRQAPTRHKAYNRMQAAIDRIHAERRSAGSPTVGDAVDLYLDWRRSGAKRVLGPRTLANDHAEAALLPDWLLATPVGDVTRADGRQLLVELAQATHDRAGRRLAGGYADRTRAKVMQFLRRALKHVDGSRTLDHDDLNVAVALKKPDPLDDAEAHAYWQAVEEWSRSGEPDRVRDAGHVALMFWGGLRVGEASGVGPDHLDERDRTIDVERHVVYVSPKEARDNGAEPGVFLVDGAKTDAGERTVPIAAPAWPVVRRWNRFRKQVQVAAPAWDGRTLMCTTATGALLAPWEARSAVERIAAEAGVPRVHPHRLRDTCATMLLAQGVPTRVIAEILGQETSYMADRYSAVSSDTVRDAVARLGTTARWI